MNEPQCWTQAVPYAPEKTVTPQPGAARPSEEIVSLQRMGRPAGVTVAELKRLLDGWPEVDASGEPTEVWLSTGWCLSSPCVEVLPLNLRVCEDGTRTADVLLEPSDEAWESGPTS